MTMTWPRAVASSVLIVVGALAVSAALAAGWLNTVLLDTDTFMAAAEPLLADPEVRSAASDRIADSLIERLDIGELAAPYVPDFLQSTLGTLADGFEEFVRTQVDTAVYSDGFASLVRAQLRAWHLTFSAAVTARGDAATLDGTTLTVQLGPYIDLLAEGTDEPILRLALARVPDSIRDTQVVALDASPFAERLPALQALHAVQPFLPWVAAVALVGGIALAPRRDWALVGTGVALAASGRLLASLVSSEAERVVGLLQKTLGATVWAESAVGTLADPLLAWVAWLGWAGVVLTIVGAAFIQLKLWRPNTP